MDLISVPIQASNSSFEKQEQHCPEQSLDQTPLQPNPDIHYCSHRANRAQGTRTTTKGSSPVQFSNIHLYFLAQQKEFSIASGGFQSNTS